MNSTINSGKKLPRFPGNVGDRPPQPGDFYPDPVTDFGKCHYN
ncbi:MAG: hypothetical protein ACRC8Y_06580 [Chroococcales cyanobacterium]